MQQQKTQKGTCRKVKVKRPVVLQLGRNSENIEKISGKRYIS